MELKTSTKSKNFFFNNQKEKLLDLIRKVKRHFNGNLNSTTDVNFSRIEPLYNYFNQLKNSYYNNKTSFFSDNLSQPFTYHYDSIVEGQYFNNTDIEFLKINSLLPHSLPNKRMVKQVVKEYLALIKEHKNNKNLIKLLMNTEFTIPSLPILIKDNIDFFKDAAKYLIGRGNYEDLYLGSYFFYHQKNTDGQIFHRDHDNLRAQRYNNNSRFKYKMVSFQLTLIPGNDEEDALLIFPSEIDGVITPRAAFKASERFILEENYKRYGIGVDEHLLILAMAEFIKNTDSQLSETLGYFKENKFIVFDDRLFGSLGETIFVNPHFMRVGKNTYPRYVTTDEGDGFFFNGNNQYHAYYYRNLSQDRLTVSMKLFTEKASQDTYFFSKDVIDLAKNYYDQFENILVDNIACSFLKIDSKNLLEATINNFDSPCYVFDLEGLISLKMNDTCQISL